CACATSTSSVSASPSRNWFLCRRRERMEYMSRRPPSAHVIDCSDLVIDRLGHGAPTRAVDGVTFTLPPGELICVAGPTGSGKSTLVAALAGSTDPSVRVVGGRAEVCGVNVRKPGRRHRELTYLTGFIPQGAGADLPPTLTVGEVIAEPILI